MPVFAACNTWLIYELPGAGRDSNPQSSALCARPDDG